MKPEKPSPIRETRSLTSRERRFVEEYLVCRDARAASVASGLDLSPCGTQADFYVYLLVDERTGSIFYVGKGKGRRFAHHEANWRCGRVANARQFQRLSAILAGGGKVTARVFAAGLSEDEAFCVERQLIEAVGDLTNVAPGRLTERERSAEHAKATLAKLLPRDLWIALRNPSPTQIMAGDLVRAGLERIADEGWQSTYVIAQRFPRAQSR